jgi:type VI secretion system secreted protein Hcp
MAVDMFLKIEGIEGESKDATWGKSPAAIDILAWSWGASNSGTSHMGGGAGAGKVNVQDMSFTKYIDKASPDLFLRCGGGEHIPKATLVVRKAGETPLEYLTITMEDILISSYSTGGSGGEDRLTENLSLNFSKVKVLYKEQSEKGGGSAKPETGWDIAANIKL